MTTHTLSPTRCPRCNGAMSFDRIEREPYCIACGYRAYTSKPMPYVSMNHGKAMRTPRPGAGRPKKQPLRREIEAARAAVIVYLAKHPKASTTAVAEALGIHRKAAESRLESMYAAHLIDKAWKAERALPNQWSVKEGSE